MCFVEYVKLGEFNIILVDMFCIICLYYDEK